MNTATRNHFRMRLQSLMFGLLYVSAAINVLALSGVCLYLAINGFPPFPGNFSPPIPKT